MGDNGHLSDALRHFSTLDLNVADRFFKDLEFQKIHFSFHNCNVSCIYNNLFF
jgi:hypothetical protein